MMGVGLASLAIISASVGAQAQPARNPAQIGDPTGTPPGIALMQNRN
jgi:hypothetical protein